MKITREFFPGDRHVYDFGLFSYEKGWAQVDMAQDPLTVRLIFRKSSPGFMQGTSVIGPGLVSLSTLAWKFDELGDATLVVAAMKLHHVLRH